MAPQPSTSKRTPGHKIYPYLLRKLAIKRSNQVWALDTTYIPMARGFVYLTAVVDVASRRVLASRVRQLQTQVVDFIRSGFKTCPYNRLNCRFAVGCLTFNALSMWLSSSVMEDTPLSGSAPLSETR